jgi:hypothetical protein
VAEHLRVLGELLRPRRLAGTAAGRHGGWSARRLVGTAGAGRPLLPDPYLDALLVHTEPR